jgi:osmotically-inducible protein OsmY
MIYRNETKFLTLLFAVTVLFLSGCPGSENNTPPVKETDVVVQTPSPTPADAAADALMKKAVEDNLKKKNLIAITVEVTDGDVTLSGPVALDKLPEAIMAANEAKPKHVTNKLSVK